MEFIITSLASIAGGEWLEIQGELDQAIVNKAWLPTVRVFVPMIGAQHFTLGMRVTCAINVELPAGLSDTVKALGAAMQDEQQRG